jgi:heptosyltransferase-2
VGPAWVGDMVMAQVLFKALKANHPDCQIDVIAPEWSKALLDRMPEVSTSYGMGIGHGALQLKKRYRIAKALAVNAYDQAIVLPNSWKSALIPWWMNVPLRTGYIGEWRFGLLNDARRLDKKKSPLMIDRFLALGYESVNNIKAFYPKLTVNSEGVASVLEKFSVANLVHNAQPVLALCPGAEFGPSKRWPEAYFAEVANQKIKEGYAIWIFGSQNDKAVAEKIQNLTEQRCIDFTGKTTLAEAIDLLSVVDWVLTNDSGLMHIAAALDKKSVVVYGPTDPKFTPPLSDSSFILQSTLACSPCFKRECPLKHHHCMQKQIPEKVLQVLSHQKIGEEKI